MTKLSAEELRKLAPNTASTRSRNLSAYETFDTRVLDRLEACAVQLRRWCSGKDDYPAVYITEQRDAARARLQHTCYELLAALERLNANKG